VTEVVLRPSLAKVSEYVKLGSMDFLLLKPINLQFFVSFGFGIYGRYQILFSDYR
jgi:ABC-type uncharacterized transport system permease subunit